jgi:hypothetical protein
MVQEAPDFLIEAGDVAFARMLDIDPAATANEEGDRQDENPAVTLRKAGISNSDRIIDFELLRERSDNPSIVIERNPDDLKATIPILVL